VHAVFDTNVLVCALLLELAVSGKADVIVTGDFDLLILNPFREIAILQPQAFLETYDT
jgi:predicted nucleic acid-binding protein